MEAALSEGKYVIRRLLVTLGASIFLNQVGVEEYVKFCEAGAGR